MHISSAGGLQYLFSVPYGVGKAAIDRMAVDMGFGESSAHFAHFYSILELKKHGVTCVSLWPGFVHTELVGLAKNEDPFSKAAGMSKVGTFFSLTTCFAFLPQEAFNKALEGAESPEFVGKAVVALAKDPRRIRKTGKVQMTADLASEYGFTDKNGKSLLKLIFYKYF